MNRLVVSAAVIGLVSVSGDASAQPRAYGASINPYADQVLVTEQSSTMAQKPSQEEAWYPGCLFTSISTGISGVSGCTDSWYGGCLATSIINMINGVSACISG